MVNIKSGIFTIIRTNIIDLERKFTWSFWILIYFAYLAFSILLAQFFIFNPLDVNSTRYLLSSLAQCQGAVISIVITLSLIAVQINSSSYTPRAINIFKKSPHMWLLLIFYIFSISASLISLNFILEGSGFLTQPYLIKLVWSELFFGIILFFALVPYMLNMINLLRSETLATMLADEITKKPVFDEREFQPFVDVITNSIIKSDIITIHQWLYILSQRSYDLFIKQPKDFNELNFSRFYFKNLEEWVKLAIYHRNDKAIEEIIYLLNQLGVSNEISPFTEGYIIDLLKDIGIKVATEGLSEHTDHVANVLGVIGIKLIKKEDYSHTFSVLNSLEDILSISEKTITRPFYKFGKSFGDMGFHINKNKKFSDLRVKVLFNLVHLLRLYAKQNFWMETLMILQDVEVSIDPKKLSEIELKFFVDALFDIEVIGINKIQELSNDALHKIRELADNELTESSNWARQIDMPMAIIEQKLFELGIELDCKSYIAKKVARLALIDEKKEFDMIYMSYDSNDEFIKELKKQIDYLRYINNKTLIKDIIAKSYSS